MFTKNKNLVVTRITLAIVFFAGMLGIQPAQAASVDFGWAVGMGGTDEDSGYSVAVDKNGNVYTTGIFSGTADFDPGVGIFNLTSAGENDIFISKLDLNGDFIWAKSIGGTGFDSGSELTVDENGNVYITGYFRDTVDFDPGAGTYNLTSAGESDIFIAKLDTNGNLIWAKSSGGSSYDSGRYITIDGDENVYVVGYFHDTADFDPGAGTANITSAGGSDIFIIKLDRSGNYIMVKAMGGTGFDVGRGIALDTGGNIHIIGDFENTVDFDPGVGVIELTSAGWSDIFITKLDGNGSFLWAKSMGGTSYDYGFAMAVDGTGNIYSVGDFEGTADFDPGAGTYDLTSAGGSDVFVSKLDSNGDFVWAKRIGGTGRDDTGDIVLDEYQNVNIIGLFSDTVDFDPGESVSNLTSAGVWDIFGSRLDRNGNFVWAKGMGGTGYDYGSSVTLDDNGNLYITGGFEGTVDFDPGVGTYDLTEAGWGDIFVAKLNFTPQTLIVTKTADTDDGVCDSDCSLREAIDVADSGDVINFDSSLSGLMIALTSTLVVDKDITIDGSALSSLINISGNNTVGGVIETKSINGITLDSLLITDGNHSWGAGISNLGVLTLIDCVVSDNSSDNNGGGIANFGELTLMNTTISGNTAATDGGGIYNDNYVESVSEISGKLTIVDSVIADNTADYGGGIYTRAYGEIVTVINSNFSGNSAVFSSGGGIYTASTLEVFDSTFISNTASSDGGGIYNSYQQTLVVTNSTFLENSVPGSGGGIYNHDSGSVLNVANSTFVRNSAGAGGAISNHSNFSYAGTLTVLNSTFSENSATNVGGAVYNSGDLYITNSIFANSISGSDCYHDDYNGGTIGINVNNLIEINALAPNNCDTPTSTVDPMLGPLADNGGTTQTMALLPDSPAIDAGDDANCPATDQRGVIRPQGSHCDIGAYEYLPAFGDVPPGHPYFNEIEILYANGLTAGCSTSPLMFCPDTILDRAQSAVFMLRGNFGTGYTPPPAPWDLFADDWTNAAWAEKWAEGMYNAGMTAGCSTDPLMFCPYDQLPNLQAAVFALRLKYGNAYTPPAATGTVFADMTNAGFWGTKWAEAAYAEGLMPSCGTDVGTGKPLFCPDELVDRGFAAWIIVQSKSLTMP